MRWIWDIQGTEDWIRMLPPGALAGMKNQKAFYSDSHIKVLFSEDNTGKWGWLKHLSLSRRDRYPTWDEILETKEYFFGDIDCMMVMPKKEDYINIHQFCFHIWQCPETWGLQ